MKYCCGNCGSEIDLQDSVWLGDNKNLCPLCGSEDTDLQEIPARETVAQWEERKGRKYPDTAPVYNYHQKSRYRDEGWALDEHSVRLSGYSIVATEAGAPPDDWRPYDKA